MSNHLDWQESRGNDAIRAPAHNFTKTAPVFSPNVEYSRRTCNLLKQGINPPKVESHKISFNTAAPILIIGTTHNSATLYEWVNDLANRKTRARLYSD